MIGKKAGKLDREKVVPYNILQEKYRKSTGKGGLSCLNIPFYNH